MVPNDTKSHLILLAAGESSRFTSSRPKHMLTHPSGRIMAVESISGISGWDIVTVALRNRKYMDIITKEIYERFPESNVNTLIVGGTTSQVETASTVVKRLNLYDHPVVFKDCDNFFKADLESFYGLDAVGVVDATGVNGKIRIDNKSFSESPYKFNCGIYGFAKGQDVVDSDDSNLHEVYDMTQSKRVYIQSSSYIDWGTQEEWDEYTRGWSTVFCDIDGCLFDPGGEHITPVWGSNSPRIDTISTISDIYDKGKTYLVLTTSRPESVRELTESQLFDADVLYDQLIMGLPSCRRVLVNDSTGLDTAHAVNLSRSNPNLFNLKSIIEGKI